MPLVDSEIKVFLTNGSIDCTDQTFIKNGNEQCITNIGYDLRAGSFAKDGKMRDSCEVNPGESVFVESVEIIRFDKDTIGRLSLKNSRIRMGFTMDAPTYQPGHETKIYFRLTNVSNEVLMLNANEQYATLIFEQLQKSPENPYNGTFQNEFSFKGLADYKSEYADQIKSLGDKIKDLHSLERSIYGNVITILTIFVAIFTILNVNISLAGAGFSGMVFLCFNVAVLGSVSFLALLLTELIQEKGCRHRILWFIPAICLIAVAVLICINF